MIDMTMRAYNHSGMNPNNYIVQIEGRTVTDTQKIAINNRALVIKKGYDPDVPNSLFSRDSSSFQCHNITISYKGSPFSNTSAITIAKFTIDFHLKSVWDPLNADSIDQ